jgi:hypothetical protein
MKNLFLVLLVAILASCGTNKDVSKSTEVTLIPCLTPNQGDTAVVLPFQDYLYEGIVYRNFEDTLRIPDYSKTYCPVP